MSPTLNQTDWLILLLFFFSLLAIGFSFRSSVKTAADYFQAGKSLPAWIGALAFLAASLGSLELISTVAAGARFGFAGAQFFAVGSVVPLLFASLKVAPAVANSGARTLPAWLALRFDRRTALLYAGNFVVASVVATGFGFYFIAHIIEQMHLFDALLYSMGRTGALVFPVVVLLCAFIVLLYVLAAGLGASLVNQAVQFLVILVAFFPVAYLGVRGAGGFAALKSALPAQHSIGTSLFALMVGVVLSAGYWCADARLFQIVLAARNAQAAARIPLVAAAARLLVPSALVLVGTAAICLPTPQSSTVVREENGAIYHEITVVPADVAAGQGLVPARAEASGNPLQPGTGRAVLDYDRAASAMLSKFPPAGFLGLGIAALLASLMSALSSAATASSAIVTFDFAGCATGTEKADSMAVATGRLAAAGFVAAAVSVAFAVSALKGFGADAFDFLLLFFVLFCASQGATWILGVLTKRTTAKGAFAGMVAGTAAALVHWGLAVPSDLSRGLHGGWIAPMIRYPNFIVACFVSACLAMAVNFGAAVMLSAGAELADDELIMKKKSAGKKAAAKSTVWVRNDVLAAAILLGALALSILFF